jgi:acyl carrier protein
MARALQAEELLELVREIAEEVLDVDLSDATPQTPLRSLGMDSADQIELVSLLEEHLEVCLPDRQLRELETVGALIGAFAELQAAQPVPGGAPPDGTRGEERPADAGR